MATANEIVRSALFRIGASSDINPASAEMLNEANSTFKGWLEMLSLGGVDVGVDLENYPPEADELGNITGTTEPLKAGFAVKVADTFNIVPPQKVINAATQGMAYIYSLTMRPRLPEYPSTLTVGAGNIFGPNSRVFYPQPEFAENYNPDGLPPEEEVPPGS